MPVKKEIIRTGWREAGGIILQAIWILLLLSLVSYHAEDISLVQSPPNNPTLNWIGPVGAWSAYLLFMGFGVGGYLLPLLFGILGLMLIFKREGRVWTKAIWMALLLLAITTLAELAPGAWSQAAMRLDTGTPGGIVGQLLTQDILVRWLGVMGAAITAGAVLLVALILLFDFRPVVALQQFGEYWQFWSKRLDAWLAERRDAQAQIEREQRELAKRRRRLEEVMLAEARANADGKAQAGAAPTQSAGARLMDLFKRPPESPAAEPPAPEPLPVQPTRAKRDGRRPEEDSTDTGLLPPPETVTPEPEPPVPAPDSPTGAPTATAPQTREKARPPKTAESTPLVEAVDRLAQPTEYILPPLSLLDDLPPEAERELPTGDFQAGAQVLKETLQEFGIEVDITAASRGPVVTRYELLPAPGVRVERISQLSNNIALAMKAESIRVQAPIPGKGVVGIEVPNPKTTKVLFREIIESDAWKNSRAALPLALGKDVGGRPIISDLAEMPHLLIAGATGSGKTVCMNSVLAGLLMSRTPDQMRLMLIDPKIVEFSGYNHLPHLVVPVITDSKKVGIGLRWAINEMETRYKLFGRVGVRNITAFNSRPIERQGELFDAGTGGAGDAAAGAAPPAAADDIPARLPYIVIVVDELADLMLVAQQEIEGHIARLAQMSRAVGIHLVLATQRPSVNVITGTIKANFPARIAFQVAQKTDSRTILDANGADKLLGKGDMLFLPPGTSKLIRAQGTLTTDHELRRIVDFIKKQGTPQYEVAIKEKMESKTADLPDMEESDDMIEAAIEVIRQTRRASTSSLQRRLRIGYTRAARLMDLLEEKGVVGPPRGSDPREILIDLDGEIPPNSVNDEDEA